jgi:trimethylamine-N-oxide reductase (cytochrome c)
VAREIKRIQTTYGKEAVTACTGSHHTWGLLGYKLSAFKRFFNLLGYTQVLDNPDSWEGFHWGAAHVTAITGAAARNRSTCWRIA